MRTVTIRWRLAVIYGVLFLVSGAGLLAVTYLLVQRATVGNECYTSPQGSRTCVSESGPPPASPGPVTAGGAATPDSPARLKALAESQHDALLHQLLVQSGIALAILGVGSVALGWFIAGRVTRPVRTITEAARKITASNLHERLALTGPDDELKRLGDTIDDLLARLETAFDAQRRFVANASHELRTPLTVMRALAQMAMTDPGATTQSFVAACRDVIAEADQQERLIDALLALARSERGLDRREPFDLAAVTARVLRARDGQPAGPRIEATTGAAPVDGDARLAERLVSNLVDNALRYNIDGGQVTISTGSHAGRSFIEVTNTGPEVPADEVQSLFEPFRRLGADPGRGDGLGLGLSIVQAVARAHGATLAVRPRSGGGLYVRATFLPATFPARLPSPAIGSERTLHG
jgi:signal transduction histidine kinase